jgi:three-Cys-motif partner protein
MSDNKFFNNLKPWSKRKHRLLSKYLPPFSAKVAHVTPNREIYCVDCFAGAAKYDDGHEGSPLLMAHVADTAAKWNNPVRLKLVNIEPNTENYDSLKKHTEPWEKQSIVRNIKGEFGRTIESLIPQMGDTPALFFIDPFGPNDIPFSHIKPIVTRKQDITELIINFDADGLRRIADSALTFAMDSKVLKANDTKLRRVSEILGTDQWKTAFNDPNSTAAQREDAILNICISKLKQYRYYVFAYPIREVINKKAEYYFIYCTRNIHGVALMNDFVRDEDDLIYGEHIENAMPLFAVDDTRGKAEEERRNLLIGVIKDYTKNYSPTSREKIKWDLIPKHFGQFHSKDYNAVVQQLINNNILREQQSGKTRINDKDVLEYLPIS